MSLNYFKLLLLVVGALLLAAPSLALRYPNHNSQTKYKPVSHQPAAPVVLIPDQHLELSRKLVFPWKPKPTTFKWPKYKPFKKRPPTFPPPPPPKYYHPRPGHPPAADTTGH
ncbi:hypothetical protein AgCh_028898 [Apium graveolens]